MATTEPVADYMLQAAGADNLTPFSLQADIMNGVDPSPQDVSLQTSLFAQHKVKVFVYNQQVTDTLTQTFITAAQSAHIPVIGVYETMPTPGFTYQSWMLAEVNALQKAVAHGVSTQQPLTVQATRRRRLGRDSRGRRRQRHAVRARDSSRRHLSHQRRRVHRA